MKKYNLLFIVFIGLSVLSCSSDDDGPITDDCPEIIEIVTQEDLELAERCGLTPTPPLGRYWISKDYKLKH